MAERRDEFYAAFWTMPCIQVPQIQPSDHAGKQLPPVVRQVRAKLAQRLQSLRLSHEDELQDAIDLCHTYSTLLQAHEMEADTETSLCRWKSATVAEEMDTPFSYELPMVCITRAMLMLNLTSYKARSKRVESIPDAAHLCLAAAGVLEFVSQLVQENAALGYEAPVHMLELSLPVLEGLRALALAVAQQLAIVKAVLFAVKPFNKSVVLKLHAGCRASYEALEIALSRNGVGTMPTRNPETALHYASVFSRLHYAQTLQLCAETEYAAGRIGEAIVYMTSAAKHFQERSSMSGSGLPAAAGEFKRLQPLVAMKRSYIIEIQEAWTKENASIYFAPLPTEEDILAIPIAQAYIMKAQAFSLEAAADVATSDAMHGEQLPSSKMLWDRTDTARSAAVSSAYYSGDDVLSSVRSLAPMAMRTSYEPTSGPSAHLIDDSTRMESLPRVQKNSMDVIQMTESNVVLEAQLRTEWRAGKPIYRLSKDKWKREMFYIHEEYLMLVRKRAYVFPTRLKVPWEVIQAVQLEQTDDDKTNFILIVAKPGVEAMSLELSTQLPMQNKVLVKLLQFMLQEKKKRTVERKSSLLRSLQEYQASLEANKDKQ